MGISGTNSPKYREAAPSIHHLLRDETPSPCGKPPRFLGKTVDFWGELSD
jgi:hypothetical protein